jgi:two-component system NtrC family sensor kinase
VDKQGNGSKDAHEESLLDYVLTSKTDVPLSITTKLIYSFLAIIILTSIVFIAVGIHLIGNRIVSEAQEMVAQDLNAAREIYLSKLGNINDVVRYTADRFFLRNELITGNINLAADELKRVRQSEGLDILTVTDSTGRVLLRTADGDIVGDDQSHNELVHAVLTKKEPVAATSIVSSDGLRKESLFLESQAYFKFIDTPKARARSETDESAGMMMLAAAPIFDYQNNIIGTIYGGVLLNRNFEIVDKIKQTVFQDLEYSGKDIGTATIFQDDVRISTNVRNEDDSRAIGTRVTEEVYNRVINQGEQWIGRAYVVNNWYITAYEPIRNINEQIIGILYVGILEQKYLDIKQEAVFAFLAVTLMGVVITILLSYFLSQRISVPLKQLVSASREVASGNLDAKVEITSEDELGELAESFNVMASALKRRDEQLKDFARDKIMESEKLAIIGQLAANVAHELNNPLQGIVTYSHLLLEELPCEDPQTNSIQKIVTQANRCRDIIRGLLDFSRQRKPDKTLCDVNSVLLECISLVENQAIFQNIQIVKDFEVDLPMIIIDPSQIERVFMNMIINAAEAMDGSGRLTVATKSNPEKKFIEIEFTDTGQGIAKEHMEKIFDPFFTTKETGHGVGLGLAISYGIVKEHKGAISVESELGKGTTFTVRLPLTVEEAVTKNGRQI